MVEQVSSTKTVGSVAGKALSVWQRLRGGVEESAQPVAPDGYPHVASAVEWWQLVLAPQCRQELLRRWYLTQESDRARLDQGGVRRVHYLSMEFLVGRALRNTLQALGLEAQAVQRLQADGLTLADVLECEPDAGLGNGGLGRLAACFLDSFAQLDMPAFGYGLRYQYGMFAQNIVNGQQTETPDDWLRSGTPWEVVRPSVRHSVGFGGRVELLDGRTTWLPQERVWAQAYDYIVPSHRSVQVATLRLWRAQSDTGLDFERFRHGDYQAAVAAPLRAEGLNWVLYPDDSTEAGRELRLKQEFLLVSASLQDVLTRHLAEGRSVRDLGQSNALHLNDTHPALAPAELMRLLIDEHGLGWDEAWSLVQDSVSYTNHTLMAEALETWGVPLMERLLPRHLQIICEINHRFLSEVRKVSPGDEALVQRVSLIDERGERRVRMAALALVASHKVNGVSALHSRLMVETIFSDYARLQPDRFINVTNGVTPRRWLMQANPGLSSCIDRCIGTEWRRDLDQLTSLRAHASDATLGQDVSRVKLENKVRLARWIQRQLGWDIDPTSLFDVQVKRIHEYKRQLLNVLHVIARYHAMLERPQVRWTPRTVIIAGKAASAYQMAKQIIALIHDVAEVINRDSRVSDRLKLVFLPNYSVSQAELIIPAADLSEQISTAGTEASGTGNMKFALNGALTLGTWDGANIEMAQAMGEDNMFVFGLRADAVNKLKTLGYNPRLYVEENPRLHRVLQSIGSGEFSQGDTQRYRPLLDRLLTQDPYLLLADFADYWAAQERVDQAYGRTAEWSAMALRNIAGMGWFSADRTVQEYRDRVWCVPNHG